MATKNKRLFLKKKSCCSADKKKLSERDDKIIVMTVESSCLILCSISLFMFHSSIRREQEEGWKGINIKKGRHH